MGHALRCKPRLLAQLLHLLVGKIAVEQIHDQRHGADEYGQRHRADRAEDTMGHLSPRIL